MMALDEGAEGNKDNDNDDDDEMTDVVKSETNEAEDVVVVVVVVVGLVPPTAVVPWRAPWAQLQGHRPRDSRPSVSLPRRE